MEITTTEAEQVKVLKAIQTIGEITHISNMSHTLIASTSMLKATKVRFVLRDLLEADCIKAFKVGCSTKVARYYYVLTEAGKGKIAASLLEVPVS